MSGNTYTVQPGAPQQFTGASIPKNSVIVNISSKGSIWISSEQYVAPGIGIELNPAASVTWIGKQLWACLDPNAVDIIGDPIPVNFTITDDISNINDPVAVAEALIINGVPNTFIVEQIYTDTIGGGGVTPLLDVSEFASLIVSQANVAYNGFEWLYQFYDDNNNPTGSGAISSPGSGPDWGLNTTFPPYQIPVSGSRFRLQNNTGDPALVTVDGTNRLVNRTQLADDNLVITEMSVTGPFTAFTNYLLSDGGSGGVFLPPRSGVVTLTATVTGSAVKGIFYLYDFSLVGLDIADTEEMHSRSDGNRSITKTPLVVPPQKMAVVFTCTDDGASDPAVALIRFAG